MERVTAADFPSLRGKARPEPVADSTATPVAALATDEVAALRAELAALKAEIAANKKQAEPAEPAETVRVRATRYGYYCEQLVRPGDTFDYPADQELPQWTELVKPEEDKNVPVDAALGDAARPNAPMFARPGV